MSIQKSITNLSLIPIQIINNSRCPYIENKVETRAFVNLSDFPEFHDQLAETGFRRVENWAYKPVCFGCNECIPLRIICKEFVPNKSQKRCQSKNKILIRSILPSQAKEEHYKLFENYQKNRHQEGVMSKMTWNDYSNMINLTPINSMIFEYKNIKNKIIGVLLIDIQRDGLSAVYSFYNVSEIHTGIGKYMILDVINFIKENSLKYLYLGYYIKSNNKMNYKNQFYPFEVFKKGKWRQAIIK